MESADEYHIQQIINIIENVGPALWPQCCIYNVPASLFKVKEEAYTPLVISIGPIHHNNKKLKEMQEQKQRYFHFFWERLFRKHDLISYKAFLEQEEQNIRHCYQKKFPDISKQQFVHMIMLDAVFIMELFLREAKKWDHKDDPVVTQPCLGKTIQRDLLLLENQLPIYVLEKLFDTVVPQNSVKMHTRFVTLAHQYLASCYPYQESSSERKFEKKKWEKSLHFTDLVRYSYLPMKLSTQHKNSEKECVLLRTATKLSKVGVSFEKVHNRCLLDIKFEKKIFRAQLQIPQLKVDHTAECVLRATPTLVS